MRTYQLIAIALVINLAACSQFERPVDSKFGDSVRLLMQGQIANPEAPLLTTQQSQSDGQSSRSAVDRYQKSFEAKSPSSNVFNIGVGTGTSMPAN